MRIAIFHNLPVGGAKRTLYEEIKYLSKKGHTLDLYKLSSPISLFDIDKFVNKTYTYRFSLDNSYPGFLNRIIRDYSNFVLLNKIHRSIAVDINAKKYDCVLVHPDKYTQAPFLLRYLSVPAIYYCHEWLRIVYEKEYFFNEKVSLYKYIYERLTRIIRKRIDYYSTVNANLIVTNSQFTAKNIYNAYKKNARVCYPGVDINKFKLGLKKKNVILFVGEPTNVNGFHYVNRLIKKLNKYKKIYLDIVSFSTATISDKELIKKYQTSKYTICASKNEPFGMSTIESFACGTPVLAIKSGGYMETVNHLSNGVFIQKNYRLAIRNIMHFLTKNDEYKRICRKAREDAVTKWSWKIHNYTLEKILYEAANP